MTTEAQVTANRLNAQESTGPRTAEGKAAVALNAVKHGLRAQAVVLPGEEPDEYEQYRERMLEDLQPQDLQEMEQAERIVDLAWRLRRAGRYHSAVFDALYEQQAATLAAEAGEPGAGDRVLGRMLVADFSGPRVLERVQLYERRIERSLLRARAEWDELHARPRRSDRGERVPCERTGAVPAAPTAGGVTTEGVSSFKCGVSSKDVGGTNKPNGTRPATRPQPAVNKQSQWQPPAVGSLGSAWTDKANFGDPIGILADLSAHKRLPARCAM
jgi:hypothetical protein